MCCVWSSANGHKVGFGLVVSTELIHYYLGVCCNSIGNWKSLDVLVVHLLSNVCVRVNTSYVVSLENAVPSYPVQYMKVKAER